MKREVRAQKNTRWRGGEGGKKRTGNRHGTHQGGCLRKESPQAFKGKGQAAQTRSAREGKKLMGASQGDTIKYLDSKTHPRKRKLKAIRRHWP